MKALSSLFFSALLLGAMAGPVLGQTVSFQFQADGYTTRDLDPGESAGVFAEPNWNLSNPNWTGGMSSNANLVDSEGNPTTIDIAYQLGRDEVDESGPTPAAGADPNIVLYSGLIRAGAGNPNIPIDITLSEITFDAYSLVLYLSSNQNNRSGTVVLGADTIAFNAYNPNGSVPVFDEITATDPDGNYLVFSGLSGSSQTFSINANGIFSPVGIAGLQIIAVPEPAAGSLLLGVAGLLALRRRRQALVTGT